jgi:hypothetical protein
MANKGRAWIKGLVFMGLLVCVSATIVTGLGLEDSREGIGGNAGALLGSGGEGSIAIHAGFAGLVVLFILMHLVVNRKSIMFTLKNMIGGK